MAGAGARPTYEQLYEAACMRCKEEAQELRAETDAIYRCLQNATLPIRERSLRNRVARGSHRCPKRTASTDGNVIKRLREGADMTQQRLAEKAGYAKRTIEKAEAGEPVREETLFNIFEALEVSRVCLRLSDGVLFFNADDPLASIDDGQATEIAMGPAWKKIRLPRSGTGRSNALACPRLKSSSTAISTRSTRMNKIVCCAS